MNRYPRQRNGYRGYRHIYLDLLLPLSFGTSYDMASSLSTVPFVVGSVIHAQTDPMTDTTITGLPTALRRASHSAAQVVISCHCAPRPTRIGLIIAMMTCAQNVGFFRRTFQLIFFSICIPPILKFCPPPLDGGLCMLDQL